MSWTLSTSGAGSSVPVSCGCFASQRLPPAPGVDSLLSNTTHVYRSTPSLSSQVPEPVIFPPRRRPKFQMHQVCPERLQRWFVGCVQTNYKVVNCIPVFFGSAIVFECSVSPFRTTSAILVALSIQSGSASPFFRSRSFP